MFITVLGIDPSINHTGYSVITFDTKTNELKIVESSVIKCKSSQSVDSRLLFIYNHLNKKFEDYNINAVGVETAFISHKFPKACLLLSNVRGVVLLLAAQKKVNITDVFPKEAKKAVTMFGGANKQFVKNMVNKIFNKKIKNEDESDATAIALFTMVKRYFNKAI